MQSKRYKDINSKHLTHYRAKENVIITKLCIVAQHLKPRILNVLFSFICFFFFLPSENNCVHTLLRGHLVISVEPSDINEAVGMSHGLENIWTLALTELKCYYCIIVQYCYTKLYHMSSVRGTDCLDYLIVGCLMLQPWWIRVEYTRAGS